MRINEENYVDKAEQVINQIELESGTGKQHTQRRGIQKQKAITTSKIRSLLSMAADIYNDVLDEKEEKLPSSFVGRINYMKIRFYYEAGRDDSVEAFMKKSEILKIIDEIGNSRKNFLLFYRYMEALVAFHRYTFRSDMG